MSNNNLRQNEREGYVNDHCATDRALTNRIVELVEHGGKGAFDYVNYLIREVRREAYDEGVRVGKKEQP